MTNKNAGKKKGRPRKSTSPKVENNEPKEKIVIEEPNLDSKSDIKDPLIDSPAIEREYTKMNVNINGDMGDIPEPNFEAININPDENTNEPEIDLSQYEANAENQFNKFQAGDTGMPNLNEADTKTKRQAAEYLADTCIAAYIQLNVLGKNFIKLDDDFLQYKALQGKFDLRVLNIQLPLSDDPTDTLTVKEFIDTINHGADETFVVSEEFKEKVRPLLITIFKKRGWGITPEQQLLALVAEDMIPKIQAIFAIKAQTKQILNIANRLLNEQFGVSEEPPKAEPVKTESEPKENEQPKRKRGRPKKKRPNDLVDSVIGENHDLREPEEIKPNNTESDE